jgi:hypothetical protein
MHFMPDFTLKQLAWFLCGALVVALPFRRKPKLACAIAATVLVAVVGSFYGANILGSDHMLAPLFMAIIEAAIFSTSPYFTLGLVAGPLLGLLFSLLWRRAGPSEA